MGGHQTKEIERYDITYFEIEGEVEVRHKSCRQTNFLALQEYDLIPDQIAFGADCLMAEAAEEVVQGINSSPFIKRKLIEENLSLNEKRIYQFDYFALCDLFLEWEKKNELLTRKKTLMKHFHALPDTSIERRTRLRRLSELGQKALSLRDDILLIWDKILPILRRISNDNSEHDSGTEEALDAEDAEQY